MRFTFLSGLKTISATLILVTCSAGLAENMVVYPLASQDVFLGVAVAERISQGFEDALEVVGPETSPGLVPPLVAEEGFFSLLRIGPSLDSLGGARLVQEMLGAENVVTGAIRFENEEAVATLYLATRAERYSFEVRAPEDDPGALAQRATDLLARTLELEADASADIDLSSAYGDYVEAITLLGAGDVASAFATLEAAQDDDDLAEEPRLASLYQDIRALQLGEMGDNAGLLATGSLSLSAIDEETSLEYFAAFAERTSLPVANLWIATLQASLDRGEAATTFAEVATSYDFGAVAEAAYSSAQGEQVELSGFLNSDNTAVLLATDSLAQVSEDTETRKTALQRLTRLAPTFVYPFNELSFIAFDEDDPLSAAQALLVATRLEPEGLNSDLYWTNLGWSYYLLGFLDRSEEASERALELNPEEVIAIYNLGLTRVVQGRLEDAMDAYADALSLDPEVNDAALEDLVNALELYPNESAIYYPLAVLQEQEGQREEATTSFEAFLAGEQVDAFYTRSASDRIEVLTAPPAPIEISDGISLALGRDGNSVNSFQPGDRVYPSFELFTPGAELPRDVSVRVSLSDDAGSLITEETRSVALPQNAIGYVVEDFGVNLPDSLAAGNYTLLIEANADQDRSASNELKLDVAGAPSYLRQLISRNIVLLELQTDAPFYSDDDLNRQDSSLLASLQRELAGTAEAAEDALPDITEGRFAGQSGGEIFAGSSTQDVTDFLSYFLGAETSDAVFHFVDAYAQWVAEGTPAN